MWLGWDSDPWYSLRPQVGPIELLVSQVSESRPGAPGESPVHRSWLTVLAEKITPASRSANWGSRLSVSFKTWTRAGFFIKL